MSKKLLQACPKCTQSFESKNYIGATVICPNCHSHFKAEIIQQSFWSKNHKKITAAVLLLGFLNFSYLVYSNWDRLMKNDSKISIYIKHYWADLKEDKLLMLIRECKQKSDFQCQMLAYKRLAELDPENNFYQRNYKAKLKRYNNPIKYSLPENF